MSIAHHEAGHAVVACAVGLGPAIREVTIVRTADYGGCVHFHQDQFNAATDSAVLTTLWAGCLAVRWHQDRSFRPVAMSHDDLNMANDIAPAHTPLWYSSREEAERIIKNNWPLIVAVADTLEDRKVLAGDVVWRSYVNARAASVAKSEANHR